MSDNGSWYCNGNTAHAGTPLVQLSQNTGDGDTSSIPRPGVSAVLDHKMDTDESGLKGRGAFPALQQNIKEEKDTCSEPEQTGARTGRDCSSERDQNVKEEPINFCTRVSNGSEAWSAGGRCGEREARGEGEEAHGIGLVIKLEPESDPEQTDDDASLTLNTQLAHGSLDGCAKFTSGHLVAEVSQMEAPLQCGASGKERPTSDGLDRVVKQEHLPDRDGLPDMLPVDLYQNKSYSAAGRSTSSKPVHHNNKFMHVLKRSASGRSMQKKTDAASCSFSSATRFSSDQSEAQKAVSHQRLNEAVDLESPPSVELPVRNRRKTPSRARLPRARNRPFSHVAETNQCSQVLRTEDHQSVSGTTVTVDGDFSSSPADPNSAGVAASEDCVQGDDLNAAIKTDSPVALDTRTSKGKRQQRYICQDCGMGFRWQSRFNEHKRKHSGEKPFICRECGDAFSSSSYLRVHERTHSGKKPYPCSICGEEFSHGRLLTLHRKHHAEEGAFTCSDCGVKCASPNELSRHRQTEHPDDISNKPFVCHLCPAAFQRSYHLETHMRSHTGEKPFMCNLCGQSYSTQGSLKVHTRSHTGERPFKCVECDRAFITSGQLKKHSRTHNKPVVTVSEDSKTVYVQILKPVLPAGRGTAASGRGRGRRSAAGEPGASSTLKLEVQSFPRDSTYSCEICGSVFVRSCDLASHIRHDHPQPAGKRENICRECGMCFSRAHTLKIHLRTHSGVKPFRCDTCRKEFAQRSNLTAHQRTHTQHKPYRCPVCGVSYSSAKYRDVHMMSHGEVRPCECVVCGSTFSSNNLLSTHLRSHDHSEIAAAWAVSAAVAESASDSSVSGFDLALYGRLIGHNLEVGRPERRSSEGDSSLAGGEDHEEEVDRAAQDAAQHAVQPNSTLDAEQICDGPGSDSDSAEQPNYQANRDSEERVS